MPQFDMNVTTPGSAVADTLQMILARRKEEKRQALLDQLNAENVRSDIDYRKSQVDLSRQDNDRQKAVADAQIASSNEQRKASMLGTLPEGETEITPEYKAENPELYELMAQRGGLRKEPDETITAYQMPTDDPFDGGGDELFDTSRGTPVVSKFPGKEFWKGSKEFQKDRIARDRLSPIMNDPEFHKLPELQKALILIQAGVRQNVPEEAIAGQKRVVPITPRGQALPAINLGPRDTAMEMNDPPQANAANSQAVYQLVNSKTGEERSLIDTADGARKFLSENPEWRIFKGRAPEGEDPKSIVSNNLKSDRNHTESLQIPPKMKESRQRMIDDTAIATAPGVSILARAAASDALMLTRKRVDEQGKPGLAVDQVLAVLRRDPKYAGLTDKDFTHLDEILRFILPRYHGAN